MPFYYDFNKSHDNAYLRFVRRIYRPLGFQKGYNFPLWVIMGGAMLGFGLARLEYLDIDGIFARSKIIGGDWYYYRGGHYHVGIIMHLAGVIPAALLVPWQFLPVIRHKAMLFHRLNGYVNILLMLVGIAGVFMVLRHTFGGSADIQTFIGILGIYVITSLALAYYNIKRLQIDQHRAWMLRAWIVSGAIITQRIIQRAYMPIMSSYGDYYWPTSCRVIDFVSGYYGPPQGGLYAACQQDPVNGWAAVLVDQKGGPNGTAVQDISASVDASFAPSGTLAMFLHIICIELYIHLTPAEGARLKQVSYERQLARGFKNPGNSGLTVQTWGDAVPWHPKGANVRSVDDGADSDLSDLPVKDGSEVLV